MAEPIWEEYGVSLADYAITFNKALDEVYERAVKNKVYLVNFVNDKPRAVAIINVDSKDNG